MGVGNALKVHILGGVVRVIHRPIGVKIFEFTPGFLHTKSLVADGEAALLGTINMDYRSFQLHYECGVALYGAPVIGTLERDMRESSRRPGGPAPARR